MTQPITHKVLDVTRVRQDFPTLHQKVNGKDLVYFDNAATTQKPQVVIDRVNQYYTLENANVHRGVHHLSQKATDAFEEVRRKVQHLINAQHEHEVIYTRGTTESINLVASSFGDKFVKEGDEIIITAMEHHSNIVPWQLLCERKGAKLRVIPMDEAGELILDELPGMLNEHTRLISLVYISNSLGTINPVEKVIDLAHQNDIPVLLDAAQVLPHQGVDVQALDCDFLVFSGHKLFGPTGTGILYGKEKWLDEMPPYQGGGEMIDRVTFEKTTFNSLPFKFEAGTPHIAGFIGLGSAIDYVKKIGYEQIKAHEAFLLDYGTRKLQELGGIRLIGTATQKASVLAFLMEGIHPYDAGTILDQLGIAIRTGHHCTQPVMDYYEIPGTMRASFSFYNTTEEIDRMVEGLQKVKQMFGKA